MWVEEVVLLHFHGSDVEIKWCFLCVCVCFFYLMVAVATKRLCEHIAAFLWLFP